MRFGGFTAVDGVDLVVGPGEVVGLLGANGAGKTTLIRMLLGLLVPTSGSVSLLGGRPSRATRRRVGYVPQSLGLYDDLTVAENWAFTSAAFGVVDSELPEGLAGSGHELVRDLSLGMQRRVAFALAFSHHPELLVLDEPTSGVGPLSSARLWEDIRASAEHGAGVLVTTHNMMEAEQCDRLVVMAGGRVAAAGTIGQVIGDRLVTQVDCDDWRRVFGVLDGDGLIVQLEGDHLRVPDTTERVEEILRRRRLAGHVTAVPANLEEAFVDIITNTSGR